MCWSGVASRRSRSARSVFGSQRIGRLAAFGIVVSSGTLLAAIGFAQGADGGALFYLVSSTLGASALFLLVELVERARQRRHAAVRVRADEATFRSPSWRADTPEDTNLDDEEQALIGRAIPAAMAFLGMAFIACASLIAGLPPLSGFVAKFALLSTLLAPTAASPTLAAWTFVTLVIGSGLLATIAWSRAGIRVFWSPQDARCRACGSSNAHRSRPCFSYAPCWSSRRAHATLHARHRPGVAPSSALR